MGCFESKSDQPAQPATTVRGHTDIFWLILYVVFWIALIVIAIFSFIYGNPLRIINGYDSFGNTCGVHSNEKYSNIPLSGMNTADKPYLFFLDVKELRHTLTVCVKECPKRELSNPAELYRYYQETFTKLCRYDFNMTFLMTPEASGPKYFDYTGPCPPLPVYQSAPVLHRCIPTGANAPLQQVKKMYALINSWEATQQVFSDLYKAWPTIVLVCALSLVFSIVIIAMLHWLAAIVSWLICIFVVVASIGITAVLWWSYYRTKHTLDTDQQLSYLEELVRNETTIYVLAIAATCIMIILLVLVYYLREKLTGLAALFEEAGKCMLQLPGLAGPPLLAFLALVVFLAFWVSVVICLATANYPGLKPLLNPITQLEESSSLTNDTKLKPELAGKNDTNFKSFKLVEYHEANVLRHMLWIYIIGLIWTSEFIFACQQLAIAGAVAFWYFRKPTDTPVLHAIAKLVKYHLGSVAKGSLIITIFKIPRLILTYLYAKLKRHQQEGSECASCCLRCCICSFWLLEKFIRYLNHNAYTVIAIEGVNFCPAAKIAWNALVTNALQVATINGIGDLVLFLGKLAVAALCGLISILLLRDNADLHFYMAPVIIITVFAFFVAHIILSLYEMVVDTLFLCVCEDRTINGNSGRWKESNLARLLGETPEMDAVEAPMQEVALTPITKQPFSAAQFLQAEMENSKA